MPGGATVTLLLNAKAAKPELALKREFATRLRNGSL